MFFYNFFCIRGQWRHIQKKYFNKMQRILTHIQTGDLVPSQIDVRSNLAKGAVFF